MPDARASILSGLRAALKAPRQAPADIALEGAALLEGLDPARPPAAADPAQAFFDKINAPAFAASIERIPSLHDLPAALRRYVVAQKLADRVTLQPQTELKALKWPGFDIHDKAAPDEALVLRLARGAIAETGSLILESGPDARILNDYLPFHHLVAVRASTVVPRLEDWAERARPMPRNAILVTGASGTTDIEGSYVRGAHGPRFLHVILINE